MLISFQQLINVKFFIGRRHTYYCIMIIGGLALFGRRLIGQEEDYAQYYLKFFKYGIFF